MNREAIYSALFAKFSAIPGFKTTDRKLRHWADVPAGQQPALYQAQRHETATTVPGQPTVWLFEIDVYVYVNTGTIKNKSPSEYLNPLMDAITAVLAPNPIDNKCTLGGLVQHAWIEGQIQTDEGTLGDQAVAIVPIILKVV